MRPYLFMDHDGNGWWLTLLRACDVQDVISSLLDTWAPKYPGNFHGNDVRPSLENFIDCLQRLAKVFTCFLCWTIKRQLNLIGFQYSRPWVELGFSFFEVVRQLECLARWIGCEIYNSFVKLVHVALMEEQVSVSTWPCLQDQLMEFTSPINVNAGIKFINLNDMS